MEPNGRANCERLEAERPRSAVEFGRQGRLPSRHRAGIGPAPTADATNRYFSENTTRGVDASAGGVSPVARNTRLGSIFPVPTRYS